MTIFVEACLTSVRPRHPPLPDCPSRQGFPGNTVVFIAKKKVDFMGFAAVGLVV
jgi:hypothetical protein